MAAISDMDVKVKVASVDVSELILKEVRELRADYNTHARETGERLTALEEKTAALYGNGRIGRVGVLEAKVESLLFWKWRVVGVVTGICGVLTLIGWWLKH